MFAGADSQSRIEFDRLLDYLNANETNKKRYSDLITVMEKASSKRRSVSVATAFITRSQIFAASAWVALYLYNPDMFMDTAAKAVEVGGDLFHKMMGLLGSRDQNNDDDEEKEKAADPNSEKKPQGQASARLDRNSLQFAVAEHINFLLSTPDEEEFDLNNAL